MVSIVISKICKSCGIEYRIRRSTNDLYNMCPECIYKKGALFDKRKMRYKRFMKYKAKCPDCGKFFFSTPWGRKTIFCSKCGQIEAKERIKRYNNKISEERIKSLKYKRCIMCHKFIQKIKNKNKKYCDECRRLKKNKYQNNYYHSRKD